MSEAVYHCPNCGGNITFAPNQQALTCSYCNHVTQIADLKRPQTQDEIDFESALATFESLETEEIHLIKCAACGAETTLAPNADSGHCDFCGTAIVVTGKTSKAMKPQYVVPFSIKMEQAEQSFRSWLKKRWFAPSALKKLARIEEPLKGIYFPFWTYDSNTETHYTGERGEHYTVQTTRRNANGQDETVTEVRTRWFPASGRVSRVFDDVLVAASKSLPPELTAKLTDWDLSQAVEYNPAVLSGFKSESYSKGIQEGFADAKVLMARQIERDIRQDIGGDEQRIFSSSTHYMKVTFKYLQLPVWSLMYRFKQKFYSVLVNGQSGVVAGKRPWSIIKISVAVLLGLAVVSGAVLLYFHYAH